MPPIDLAAIKALAALTPDDLGDTEEDVKIHFVVHLLHALGHTRLRFEHKDMDILLKEGLPRGSTVVVEVKRPDLSLDAHVAQLERYSFDERALVAVLTNGRVLRVYAPFWNRAKSFSETLLWEFSRGDLAQLRHVEAIASVLSHEALASKAALTALQQRQATVEFVWEFAEDLRQRHREWGEQLEQRLREIDQQIARLDAERSQRERQLGELGVRERDKIRRFFRLAGVPLAPTGEFGYLLADGPDMVPAEAGRAAAKRPPKSRPREWSDDELYKNATTYQRRVFAAFVSLGQRTVALKELAHQVGLSPHSTVTALTSFRRLSTRWGRDTLIEVERTSATDHAQRGHIYSIAPRYWPVIQRLYRKGAP